MVVVCPGCSKDSGGAITRVACVTHADRLCLPECAKDKQMVHFLPVNVTNLERLQSVTAVRVRQSGKWFTRAQKILRSPFTATTKTPKNKVSSDADVVASSVTDMDLTSDQHHNTVLDNSSASLGDWAKGEFSLHSAQKALREQLQHTSYAESELESVLEEGRALSVAAHKLKSVVEAHNALTRWTLTASRLTKYVR